MSASVDRPRKPKQTPGEYRSVTSPVPTVKPPIEPPDGKIIGYSVDPIGGGRSSNWHPSKLLGAVSEWWCRGPSEHDLVAVAFVIGDGPDRTMICGYNAFSETWDEWE